MIFTYRTTPWCRVHSSCIMDEYWRAATGEGMKHSNGAAARCLSPVGLQTVPAHLLPMRIITSLLASREMDKWCSILRGTRSWIDLVRWKATEYFRALIALLIVKRTHTYLHCRSTNSYPEITRYCKASWTCASVPIPFFGLDVSPSLHGCEYQGAKRPRNQILKSKYLYIAL